MHRIVVYSKEGCHLCEKVLNFLRNFTANLDLRIIEITDDPIIFKEFYLSIPVVELDGKIVFQASDINSPGDLETKLGAIVAALK